MSAHSCCGPYEAPQNNHPDQQTTGRFIELDNSPLGDPTLTNYNPSIPIFNDPSGIPFILARNEKRRDEHSSRVVPFDWRTRQPLQGGYILDKHQDPYHLGTFDDGLTMFGAVKIEVDEHDTIIDYYDEVFAYEGSYLDIPAEGPTRVVRNNSHQKDLRFGQLLGRIGVMPRPQGEFGGAGEFHFFETDDRLSLPKDLDRFYADKSPKTKIEGVLEDGEWGGPNQLFSLDETHIYVVGHKAWKAEARRKKDETMRHYKGIGFVFNTERHEIEGEVETLVEATQFSPLAPKLKDLGHVVFISGITEPNKRGTCDIYGGIGDVAIGRISIPDPRLRYASQLALAA